MRAKKRHNKHVTGGYIGIHTLVWHVCTWLQSIPREVMPSSICLDFTAESSVMGERPEFSARAMGTSSKASAKLRTAYCTQRKHLEGGGVC